jgi:phosphatidylethanolamine-binding protein (PEBP) family uncharacterized protein
MYITSSLVVAALASCAIAQAQTPRGFTPSVNTKLELFFNTTSVKTPGELLSKASMSPSQSYRYLRLTFTATATEPQLAISGAAGNMSDTFMFVMLDLDVPPQQGSTQRRVLLHAMNTGFKATQQKLSGAGTLLASKQKGPAMYIPPGPPATDTVAHRYVQLLFREPATLKVQASDFANTTARIGFDIETFMTEHKLGAPVAGNFFMVDGRANSTAGNGGGNGRGTATGTGGGGARNTLAPFEGRAGKVEMSFGLLGALGAAAMLVL